jgi:DNA mismatch endonuclease (patch repair protein)
MGRPSVASRTRLAVSYADYTATSSVASRVGRANRKRDTGPELMLRRRLWAAGLRYRLHGSAVLGTPDIAIRNRKIAIFCDGDFWHGRNWKARRARLARGSNASYWTAKIRRNIERDRAITRRLRAAGWLVVRVWEGDVMRDPERVAVRVLERIALRDR